MHISSTITLIREHSIALLATLSVHRIQYVAIERFLIE